MRTIRQAASYAWMYSTMLRAGRRRAAGLNIAAGALGGVATAAGVVLASDPRAPAWAWVLQIVLGMLVAAIAMAAAWRPAAAQELLSCQMGYNHLAKELVEQLSQPRGGRPLAREFVRTRLGEAIQIRATAPPISGRVRRAYAANFRGQANYMPEDQLDTFIAEVPELSAFDREVSSDDASELDSGMQRQPEKGGWLHDA